MKKLFIVIVILGVFGAVSYSWLKFRPAPAARNPQKPAMAAVPSTEPAPAPAAPIAPPAEEIVSIPTAKPVKPAEPENLSRTWTNRDGRSLKAEFITATASDVTVKREDGRVFTIPYASLAAEDVLWARARLSNNVVVTPTTAASDTADIQPIPVTPPAKAKPAAISQQQIDRVVDNFPAAGKLVGNEVTNDLQQLHTKYLGMVKFIRPGTIEANLKMIRAKIEDDIKRLTPIAGTVAGDWTGKRHSSQSAAAENTILSARKSLTWLQGPLTQHLTGYDALLETQKR